MRTKFLIIFSFILIIIYLGACEHKKSDIGNTNQQITITTSETPIDIPQKKPTDLPKNVSVSPSDIPSIGPDPVKQIEPITWYADITHDGIDDKIVVDLTYVINYPETGVEHTVSVYSGKTGTLIWTGHADTVHVGWNGIYVYKNGNHQYLLLWKPMIYQDAANFSFEVFSLTEKGTVQKLSKKTIDFDMMRPSECDTNAISNYIQKVNNYLKKSYVLVDTDNGTPVYSTKKNKIINLYNGSRIFNEIEERNSINNLHPTF